MLGFNFMPGFFAILGKRAGSQQQENQLSSTFQACFLESVSFRHIVLKRLWRTCRLPNLPPLGKDWVCDVEVAPPLGGGGRVDLALRVGGGHRKIPTFWIESKVGAPLSQTQLKKYRKHECEYVVALTRRRPELPPSQIKELGAFALRWQDIHRDLDSTKSNSQKDRFIASSFLVYLEDLGMAHPERITLDDLKRVGSVFRSLAPGNSSAVVKDGFATADAVVELMATIRVRLLEDYPKLRKLNRYGPGIGASKEDKNIWIGWSLYKTKFHDWNFRMSAGFSGDGSEAPWFDVSLGGRKGDEQSKWWWAKTVCRGNAIDEDKLYREVRGHALKWGVVK